jgi:hypothetical protein
MSQNGFAWAALDILAHRQNHLDFCTHEIFHRLWLCLASSVETTCFATCEHFENRVRGNQSPEIGLVSTMA